MNYNQSRGGMIRTWTKKYDADGEDALVDKRGHPKVDAEVDELECLKHENLRLKRQLKEKNILTELLKKGEVIVLTMDLLKDSWALL